jgi:hypothetical protein
MLQILMLFCIGVLFTQYTNTPIQLATSFCQKVSELGKQDIMITRMQLPITVKANPVRDWLF